jgi:hypothetical protein
MVRVNPEAGSTSKGCSGQLLGNVLRMLYMSAVTEAVPSEADILSRVMRPDHGTWSRAAAEAILEFAFPDEDVQRMNALAAKAREGSLSNGEEAELENYRHAGRLLELLQSKARLSLKRLAAPA